MKKASSGTVGVRRAGADVVFDTVNVIINLILVFICLYPLYFVLIASISDPYEVVNGNVFLFPKGFSLDAYSNVVQNKNIWIGYRNTLLYSSVGTFFSLILTIPPAYALSKRRMPGRALISIYFLIPVYFSAGLIPTYLIVKQFGLVNKWYTLIFVNATYVYNMIVSRVFYETTIPEDVFESARIDGASELRTFFTIALPLSGPIIAVMALFFAVSRWNNYFDALVYVNKNDYLPLQMVLRSTLLEAANALKNVDITSMSAEEVALAARRTYVAEAMKYALIVVSSLPLLVAYPFVQKFFVKGMMIGAVKG